MITITRRTDLDSFVQTEHLTGVAFTGEAGGHQFVITALRDKEPVTLTGSVSGMFIGPDGAGIELDDATIDVQGRAVVTMKQACYGQRGPFGIRIFHAEDGGKLTVIYSAAGFMDVGEPDTVYDPGNKINVAAIEAKIHEMDQAVSDCNAAADAALAVAGDIAVAGTGTETLTLSNYDLLNCTISSSATLTVNGTTYQSRKIVRNPMWETISITANSTGATYATFFTSAFPSTITSGADVSGALATGETGRHEIATGTTAEFDIPSNAAYIIVTTKSTSDRTPAAVEVSTFVNNMVVDNQAEIVNIKATMPTVDATLSVRGKVADAKQTGDIRAALNAYGSYQMDMCGLLPLVWYSGLLTNSGEPDPTAETASIMTYFIPIEPSTTFDYTKKDTVNVMVCLEYDSNKTFIRQNNLRSVNTSHTVGSETHYIRFSYQKQSGSPVSVLTADFAYENFKAVIPRTESDTLPIGLHTMPKNQGVLNCIKRARQMTDIKWSPAVSIDRVNIVTGQSYADTHEYYQNQFLSTCEYTGLPYSSKNWIGVRKSLDAFITSAANPNSKECTDSAYSGNENVASYFGTVCVTLVAYALHAPMLNSPNFTNMNGLTKQYDLYSGGAYHSIDDLELCDVLWEHGHVGIITDIIKDGAGNVTHVEVSESTKFGSYIRGNGAENYGGKCRRKTWTKDDFLQWFASFGVYRYADELLANIPYYPNKYVPMADEPQDIDQAVLPCIPEEGNKSYFFLSSSSQRNVKILILQSGYDYLRVKQDGENFALLDVTGLTETTVACDSSKEALYEAYLCKMSNGSETVKSASCYFRQIGTTKNTTIHANSDGSYTITYQRDTDISYPFAVIYNGTGVNEGYYSPVTGYTKSTVSGKTQYSFTVTPPSSVSSISTVSFLTDLYDYGWCPSSAVTPTVV